MPVRKKQKSSHPSKRLYIYMAFVTMVVVHFFTKPFQKGLGALGQRLKNASGKSRLREQLKLGQQDRPAVPLPAKRRTTKKKIR